MSFEKDAQEVPKLMYTHLIISQQDLCFYHLFTIGNTYPNATIANFTTGTPFHDTVFNLFCIVVYTIIKKKKEIAHGFKKEKSTTIELFLICKCKIA